MTDLPHDRVGVFQAEVMSKLDTIERIGACSDGRVCVLDFGAIRTRLGERWEARKFAVYELIGRFIERIAGKAVMHTVVEETLFVVCFAEGDRADAAGLSYRIVEDVLSHFLGSFDPADVKIAYVTLLADGQVTSRALNAKEAFAVQARSTAALKPRPKVTPEPVLIENLSQRVPVQYGVETILAVRQSTAIGYRLSANLFDEHRVRPLSVHERAVLPTASLLAIDLRTLSEANSAELFSAKYPCAMIPLSIQNFSSSRARTAIFDTLNKMSIEERGRLLIELVGIEEGAPASGLIEALALLKPFARKVLLQAPVGRAGIAKMRSARASAISVAFPDVGGGTAKIAAQLLSVGEALRGVSPTLIATGLPSDAMLAVCDVAGFTHATVKA